MRNSEWPPSLWRSNSPSSFLSKSTPHFISSWTVSYTHLDVYKRQVFYSNVNPQWIEGTHQFWYVRNTPDGRLYVSVDADKKARKELCDSHRLAKARGAASGKEVKPEARALGHLSVSKGLETLHFVFNNQRWMYASRKNQLVNEGALPLLSLIHI